MAIGELLLAKNFINEEQLKKVLHQQKIAGGRIGDNLIALGYITREKLETILQEPPSVPKTIEETGLDTNFLLNSILRIMYISALQTTPEIAEQIKLTRGVVESLLDFAKKEALVEIRGPSEKSQNIMRYALTSAGKERASEALRRCEYIGSAPVPLDNPALFSITIAFAGIWLFSVLDRSARAKLDRGGFDAQYVRCQTGIGAAGATTH